MTEIAKKNLPPAAKLDDPLVLPEGIAWSKSSAVVTDPKMTFDRIEAALSGIRSRRDATSWWFGDLLLFAESRWGEQYAQAMDATGLSYSRLTGIVSTCQRVPPERRHEDLSFDHHDAVAALDEATQEEWLSAASESSWTRQQLRDALRDAKALPTRSPRSPSEAAAQAESKKAAATVDTARNLVVVHETLDLVKTALDGGPDPQQTVTDLEAKLPHAMRALEEISSPVREAAGAASLLTAARDVIKAATVSGGFAMIPTAVYEPFQAAVKEEG